MHTHKRETKKGNKQVRKPETRSAGDKKPAERTPRWALAKTQPMMAIPEEVLEAERARREELADAEA